MLFSKMRKFFIFTLCCFASYLFFLCVPKPSQAAPLSIKPYKIILNSPVKGEKQDVQANIAMTMPSGYALTDYEVYFVLSDDFEVPAYSLTYCYIDDIFLASFDRAEIQDYLVLEGLLGTIPVKVEGWYEATDTYGAKIVVDIIGYASIEVINPGNN